MYLDNILVSGKSEEEHPSALEQVLNRLEEAGLLLNRGKCVFMAESVAYLGHIVDAQGLHPNPDKVRAIEEVPPPQCISELKSYLGLLTYYSKFCLILLHCLPLCMLYSAMTHHGHGTRRERRPSRHPRNC